MIDHDEISYNIGEKERERGGGVVMAWGLIHKNIILINIDERLSEMTRKQRNCDGIRMKEEGKSTKESRYATNCRNMHSKGNN